MKRPRLLRLYPEPLSEVKLQGLYLAHRLHEQIKPPQDKPQQDKPCVYGNFLSSLDGRIALINQQGHSATPSALKTASDWQLFQELQAQADCIITHGGYLRALAAGDLGNILQITTPALQRWRQHNGLAKQPAVVVASASLDFPIADSIQAHQQDCYIATGAASDPTAISRWQQRGYSVILAGQERTVEGRALIDFLGAQGYRSIYLLAGPQILETMLRDGLLSRLYLTLPHQLIGGERFHSMINGLELGAAGRLNLRELYLETGAETGQFFACYEPLNALPPKRES
jgi:riboflavin biosynthesis pyrimidine reductase